jgi:hypothetical protein
MYAKRKFVTSLASLPSLFMMIGLAAGTANAATLPMAGYYVSDNDSGLWHVNPTNGSATFLGITSNGDIDIAMRDIAFAPAGNLYGISETSLYSIDPNTAVTTYVGPLGVASPSALDFRQDGMLFMATSNNSSPGLYTINTSTGAASYVGNTGYVSDGDIAFDVNGNLYLLANTELLVELDPLMGSGAIVGSHGLGDTNGMDFVDDLLVAITSDNAQLFGLDTDTGVATYLADMNPKPSNATISGATYFESERVPEPTGLALVLSITALPILSNGRTSRVRD